jgi:hypothetical protein
MTRTCDICNSFSRDFIRSKFACEKKKIFGRFFGIYKLRFLQVQYLNLRLKYHVFDDNLPIHVVESSKKKEM